MLLIQLPHKTNKSKMKTAARPNEPATLFPYIRNMNRHRNKTKELSPYLTKTPLPRMLTGPAFLRTPHKWPILYAFRRPVAPYSTHKRRSWHQRIPLALPPSTGSNSLSARFAAAFILRNSSGRSV